MVSKYAVQMDVKATYDDGSVRHAILSMETPQMADGTSAEVMFALGNGASGSDLTVTDILSSGYDLSVDVYIQNNDGSETWVRVDAAQLLQQAAQNGTLETWISGPLSSEFSLSASVALHLDVRFNIQVFADGDIRTDVIFANDDAFSDGIRDITYGVSIQQNNQEVYSAYNIDHYRASNWHQEIWSGDTPDLHYQHDVWYLMQSGAIPNYDATLGVAATTIQGSYDNLLTTDTGPLGNAQVLQYMPTTGGRSDIGILPDWAVQFLITQDEMAKQVMLANADAAGSVPWHLIDEATGEAVSLFDNPNLWVDPRSNTLSSDFFASSSGGWNRRLSTPTLAFVCTVSDNGQPILSR